MTREPIPEAERLAAIEASLATVGAPVRRIDTHAAHVFLAGDRAWKLKRPVRYAYLDFSTPDRRRDALERELLLNRRSAPELYRGVHALTREADGSLTIDGDGTPVDWLLEMTRFPDGALLADAASEGALDDATLLALADAVAGLHARAERDRGGDGAARVARVIEGNRAAFAAVSHVLDPQACAALEAAQRAELARHARHLDLRATNGRVCRGHGDLHLANVAGIGGKPVLFDCLEFSEELATVDVLYDLAFLLMDLWHRGLRIEANMVANRYLDVAPQGAAGYALLPLFVSIRAAIRAHVRAAAARADSDATAAWEARAFLGFAAAVLTPASPQLVAVGGLSGTGKTTIARRLGAPLGRAPGARVLRSDVFRKRLAGLAPEMRLPPESYTRAASAETYEALFESADDHLGCGSSVVLDAVFANRSERDVAALIGARRAAPFTGIFLEAPEQDRIARVAARSHDASDAGVDVVREQSRRSVGDLSGWHRIRANRPVERIVAAARAAIDRSQR